MKDQGHSSKGASATDVFNDRLVNLSPARRALFEMEMKKQKAVSTSEWTIPRRLNQESSSLSFAQQRLWFLNQLEPDSLAYNQRKEFRLSGTLNTEILKQALSVIVARHEVLRTTFSTVDGEAVQVVRPSSEIECPVFDISSFQGDRQKAELEHRVGEIGRQPFDLSRDLMLRSALIRLAPTEHVLVLVSHHIASDAWSTDVFFREFAALYEAFAAGKPSPLPELPIQYADFAVWQRQWLQGEVLEKQLSYWKTQLKGVRTLDFPTDRSRPRVQTFHGAKQELFLSTSSAEGLRRLTRQEHATPFMTLLAAFTVLLQRHTGQDDVVVGSPIAGRNRAETEGLIGFFVNTLVLRTDLSGNPTFRELLARVREMTMDAYAHQDLPFEKLVEELQPERELSRGPLFQVFFNMVPGEFQELSLYGMTVKRLVFLEPESKFDLTLYVKETGPDIQFKLVYNNDLFRPDTIALLLDHFQTLLEGIATNPDRRISDLPMLTPAEKQQLLVTGNETTQSYLNDRCIHELFEAQVERTPDAVGLVFENERLTYRELNERANQVARCLRKLGVGPEIVVGISIERSPAMVVGLLAILKAGGAYVPLDPEYPKARLHYMTDQAQIGFLLTTERLLTHFPTFHGRVVCLDRDCSLFEPEEKQNPQSIVEPDNLAYVIYTSGSTGKPKGVLGCHHGVANYFSYLRETYNLSPSDTVLQIPSLSFDASLRDLIGPLTVGAQVVIVNALDVKDSTALLAKIKEHGVTCILSVVPTLLNELVEVASTSDAKYDSLRLILVSGEALPITMCRATREIFGDGTCIVNQYGPTESTLTSSYHPVFEADFDRRLAPLGKPIPNARMCILDEYLNLVPIGVPGELHIAGIGITRGYINSPDLTAERFVPDPLSGKFGARLYKTGDLARHMPDGTIDFLGRIDHQVKIRGVRVELGEVEVVLTRHPAVEQALVVAHKEVGGLVAYIVPKKDHGSTMDDFRRFLKQELPEYMVPADFVLLDAFPLTPNRKVDRRALPGPVRRSTEGNSLFVEPGNPIEQRMAEIWAEFLKVDRLSVHENFFDLGGHSLLATRVISRIRQEFQTEIPLSKLFENPTVAALARQIVDIREKGAVSQKLDQALANLEALSDQEARLLLTKEDPIASTGGR